MSFIKGDLEVCMKSLWFMKTAQRGPNGKVVGGEQFVSAIGGLQALEGWM